MDEKVIKDFNKSISILETALLALKWLQHRNNTVWGFVPIINGIENELRELKILCVNHIGCIEE